MKQVGLPIAIAILVCAIAAPALAQQSQSSAETEQSQQQHRDRRSYTGGRFTIDLAGHNVGFVDKVGDQSETPTIQPPGPAAVTVVHPSAAVRPGTITIAPVTEDKDGDDD